jgi:hypothetical protein
MGVLLADVDASGRVDSTDIFRMDVDASGRIDSTDVFITQQQSLTSLPSPP